MKIKFTKDDVMMWLVLFMQLGFHTNTVYDDYVSIGVTVLVTLYFVLTKINRSIISIKGTARYFIIWYTLVVALCAASYGWADQSNSSMIRQLIVNTYIPLLLLTYCVNEYLQRGSNGVRLLTAIVAAEICVGIRALVHTPVGKLIATFDTRLYGTGLGVNYNHFTTQFALVFCIALFLAYDISKSFYIPAAFLFFNIVVSGSRKVLLVSVLCFTLIYLLSSTAGNILKRAKKVLFVVAVVGVGLWFIMTNEFLYKLIGEKTLVVISEMLNIEIEGISSDASTDQRRELIVIAFDVFRSHPLTGVGYYSFQNYNRWNVYAHNNYMELLADLGITGFLLYYSYYIKILIDCFRKKHTTPKTDFFKLRIGTDFMKSKWNLLGLTFVFTLMFMEYGQVTYFRPYVLVPILVVSTAIENMKKKDSLKRGAV